MRLGKSGRDAYRRPQACGDLIRLETTGPKVLQRQTIQDSATENGRDRGQIFHGPLNRVHVHSQQARKRPVGQESSRTAYFHRTEPTFRRRLGCGDREGRFQQGYQQPRAWGGHKSHIDSPVWTLECFTQAQFGFHNSTARSMEQIILNGIFLTSGDFSYSPQ